MMFLVFLLLVFVTTFLVRVCSCSRGRPHLRNSLLRNWVISNDHVYCCMVVKKLITKTSTSTHFVVYVYVVIAVDVFTLLRTRYLVRGCSCSSGRLHLRNILRESESYLMIMCIVAWLWRRWSRKPLPTLLLSLLFLLFLLLLVSLSSDNV